MGEGWKPSVRGLPSWVRGWGTVGLRLVPWPWPAQSPEEQPELLPDGGFLLLPKVPVPSF